MKERDPENEGSAGLPRMGDDDHVDVKLDVGDVDLAGPTSARPSGRRTAPPPLPPSAFSMPPQQPSASAPPGMHSPSHAPSQVPPYPTNASIAPEPPPRSKLLYGLILVGFFVVCLGAGAIYVRASAPKPAPDAAKSSAAPPSAASAPASPSADVRPKVITINPVDMGGNETP